MQSSEVNALPDRVRRYIHDLETRCDLAGEVRDLWQVREQRDALAVAVNERDAEIAKLRAEVADLARLRAIEAAAAAFLPAHDQATFDMKPVYGCAFAHGVQFVGKGYGEELEALRAALDAAQGGG